MTLAINTPLGINEPQRRTAAPVATAKPERSVSRQASVIILTTMLVVLVVVAGLFFATGFGAGYALGLGFYLAFWIGGGAGIIAAGVMMAP